MTIGVGEPLKAGIIVYVQDGKCSEPSITVTVDSQTTAGDVVRTLVTKARLLSPRNYELAEVFVCNGQLCKERRLDVAEFPLKVQALWPKGGALAPDATYRFYLLRKDGTGDTLRSLSWSDYSQSIELSADTYFTKFLDQKKSGANCSDLCSLPDLNERTLLENLRDRFYSDQIYTFVGSILISVNPFKFFPVYNPKYVMMYQGRRIGELPPHIFAIADAAFTNMLETQTGQCIVISGESGSGKTENTNLLLHHLTHRTPLGLQNHHGHGVEQTLLGAGPVLEAFGNAKTVFNDNSSRFGKFIQVDFKKNGAVHGALVEKYLLEKSRIVSQAADERNYHVFYYLLGGASAQLKADLYLQPASEYHYLNQSGHIELNDPSELREYERLQQSMEMVGFKPELQKKVFAVISAILLLGNVEFAKKHSYHHGDAVQVKNIELVTRISHLLNVKQESFLEALTSKRTVAGGETMIVNYRHEDAVAARDAMAKCLYGAIFDWIVWQINHSLFLKQDHKECKNTSIGVLDIFGFECFEKNSFEQFCINYANEHLQYYFNQHIFKLEQEEYRRENINWQDIVFIDNTGCLELFSKRPNGLFFLLDEQGNFPGATNETLLEKFHNAHRTNEFYKVPLKKESTFTIVHYAGKVKYFIQDFREKNSDLIHADLVSVLKNSNTAFVRELVGSDPIAMLRWSFVRLVMKSVWAFTEAGRKYHGKGGSKIGELRRRKSTSLKKKDSNANQLAETGQLSSEASEAESLSVEPIAGEQSEACLSLEDEAVHVKSNKSCSRKQSQRKRQRMYMDYRKFKTYQDVKNRETAKAKAPSVSLQFQKSLQLLLETLDEAHPFFVRCIKSNGHKMPLHYDDKIVLKQLQYTGMLATVKLRQSGYNHRLLFQDFVNYYALLLPHGRQSTRQDVNVFLSSVDTNTAGQNFQLGHSKVFMRETVKMLIDTALHNVIMRGVVRIQAWWKARLDSNRYLEQRRAAIVIQKHCRGWIARKALVKRLHETRQLRWEREREVAAQRIQCWYKRMKAIRQARERHRHLKQLSNKDKEVQSSDKVGMALDDATAVEERLPVTDIDQLAESLTAEDSLAGHEETRMEIETRRGGSDSDYKPDRVESWLDVSSVNNGELKNGLLERIGSPPYSQSSSKFISNSDGNTAKSEGSPGMPSANSARVILRKGSIERRAAFRRRSAKEDELPQLQKRTARSCSSYECYPSRSSSPSSGDEDAKPIAPEARLLSSTSPPYSPVNDSSKHNLVSASKEAIYGCKDLASANEKAANAESAHHDASSTHHCDVSAHRNAPSGHLDGRSAESDSENANSSSLQKENLDFKPYLVSPSITISSTEAGTAASERYLFDEKHSTDPLNSSVDMATHKAIRPGTLLRSNSMEKTGGNEPAKAQLERISSNDRTSMRKSGSRSNEELSDLSLSAELSPSTPGLHASSPKRLSHHSSVDDEDNHFTPFSRMNVLRQNVRKSHSADCLAPGVKTAQTNANTALSAAGQSMTQTQPKVAQLKERSFNSFDELPAGNPTLTDQQHGSPTARHLLNKLTTAVLQHNIPGAARANAIKAEMEDSDLDDTFEKVSLPVALEKLSRKPDSTVSINSQIDDDTTVTSARTSQKRKEDKKEYKTPAGQYKVASTSEWQYPDTLVITDMHELSSLSTFIYNKYVEFKTNVEKLETMTMFDRVFKDALKEINTMLITRNSTAMQNEKNWSPLKYRDLMTIFQDFVKVNAKKNVSAEQAAEFPTTIAINAFRGYLDEFQKHHKSLEPKEKRAKKKEQRKKLPREVQKVYGHQLVSTQFNIPTFCEVCKGMMFWNIKDKGFECAACKFSCHKKCASKCTTRCPNRSAENIGPTAIFGVPLSAVTKEDGSGPPVIEQLIDALDTMGLYTDGIYRKSGAAPLVRALKKAIDTDWTKVDFSEYNVHVLSLTLKNYFRELPEPVFTFDLYDEFIRCSDITDEDEAVEAMRTTVNKLPSANYCLISRLMLHLARIAQNEATNRMNANSLSIVFAPGLLRSRRSMPAQESLNQIAKQCKCVELILSATLKKLNSTLQSLDRIESEKQRILKRLDTVRESIRSAVAPPRSVVKRDEPWHKDTGGLTDPCKGAVELQEEEAMLSKKMKTLNKQKTKLKKKLPDILSGSDADDMHSADDIDSSGESLDGVSQD